MTLKQKQNRDLVANEAEKAANQGHYLERLENIAVVLNDRDSQMAVMALKQLYIFSGCKPNGSDGIQYEISMRILIKAERDFKFTKKQLSKLWYGVHWDTHKVFGLKFPYENKHTQSMKSNTSIRGA